MKKAIIFMTLCFGFAKIHAQNDNPYSVFGYQGKVLKTEEEISGKQYLFLNTNDTTQQLKTIAFNTKTRLIEYIDHNDKIYKTDSLLPTFVLRFLSTDPHAKNYPGMSPYNFVGNMPIRAVDPDGRDIYILFYTSGHTDPADNEMFRASALTRKVDIERSKGFDKTKDVVVMLQVQDMASIQKQVNNVVKTLSPQYGQTQEFSIWSHAANDGPTGTLPTSSNAVDGKQMSPEGWGKIDFNWKNNGTGTNANFFGCNTGNESGWIFKDPSFAQTVSGLQNFSNVTVAGQPTSAFPSKFTNYRQNSENGPGNFINSETNDMIYFQRTYLVAGEHSYGGLNSAASQNVAHPMQLNVNGQTTGTGFQTGTTKKP
ncbi:MAG: hypothetical protein JST20_02135 [Bacteroidetes bacterium]|nr:hypothetical protein [Bacteroidota bacterium]